VDHKQFEDICKQLCERKDDIRPSDAVIFPEPLSSTLTYAVRISRISLTEFAKRLDLKTEQARQLADLLITRKLFHHSSYSNTKEIFYETQLSAMTRPLARPTLGQRNKTDDDQ